jgi:hypothetical protein
MTQALNIKQGSIYCYRLFDVADEIDLQAAERILAQSATRLRFSRQASQYLILPNPPLTLHLGSRRLRLISGEVRAEASARVFDHGAASVILRIPIEPGTALSGLIPLASELYDSAVLDTAALELIEGLRQTLAAATQDSHLWTQNESYTIVFVEEFERQVQADELVKRDDLTRLIVGEAAAVRLSVSERRDVMTPHFSYTEADLAIIDWNSAFVYEPSGSSDIRDVLEIANAQLLELRYYDEELDRNIQSTYDEMQRSQRQTLVLSPYRRLARRVLVTLLEMSELIERVENSLKIIGDFYLAKVYEGALVQLRIPNWQASVTRKQQMLENTYRLMKDDVDTNRSLMLEAMIALLIVSELVLALVTSLAK